MNTKPGGILLKRKTEVLFYYDRLTGLPNRAMFLKEIDRFIASKYLGYKNFAVLLLNLDRFKVVNTSLGYEKGDLLLEAVSKRLRDHLVGIHNIYRLYGDEFAIIIDDISFTERVSKRISSLISEPFNIDGHQIFITASMGIACYPKDGDNTNTLIKNVYTAMHEAKKTGKNRIMYYFPNMNKKQTRGRILCLT
ncbi:MAG: diguanylate cyclase domain-containing protein [Candidatus Alkaliphilus sp. MAG34]